MIQRSLQPQIEHWLFRNKVIILYGARQVGKTTLAKALLSKYNQERGYYNCEIQSVREVFSKEAPGLLLRYIGEQRMIVLDEAQQIPNIGKVLKLLVDSKPDLQIIATGSSSFDLANRTSEPLTGRALQFVLYPFSYLELKQMIDPFERRAQLPIFLKYGLYPEIALSSEEDARILLDDLTSKYLYKDILEFENLKRSDILFKLLQLLALQIGQEISYNELANNLQTNRRTVERYIDLLEKTFVIFRLRSFSRNLRKEINKGIKIYFFDIGVRNSIVQQYQDFDLRSDKGSLWENFLVCERQKYLQRVQRKPNIYFWRTHDQQEVDYLEEFGGDLDGYEIKWKHKKQKAPSIFLKTYPNSKVHFIDQENFEDFIL